MDKVHWMKKRTIFSNGVLLSNEERASSREISHVEKIYLGQWAVQRFPLSFRPSPTNIHLTTPVLTDENS
jgi:hypothetical protein